MKAQAEVIVSDSKLKCWMVRQLTGLLCMQESRVQFPALNAPLSTVGVIPKHLSVGTEQWRGQTDSIRLKALDLHVANPSTARSYPELPQSRVRSRQGLSAALCTHKTKTKASRQREIG